LAAQNGHNEVVGLINHVRYTGAAWGWRRVTARDRPRPTSWWCCSCGCGFFEEGRTQCTPRNIPICSHNRYKDTKKWHLYCCQCGDGPNCCQCGNGPDRGHSDGRTGSSGVGEGWIAVDRFQEM
jgi:hypothetical protein